MIKKFQVFPDILIPDIVGIRIWIICNLKCWDCNDFGEELGPISEQVEAMFRGLLE